MELCELLGVGVEEHVVVTGDGWVLGVHRLIGKGRENGEKTKGVVYMHHGLLMNSEVWVCVTERERCLPVRLVEMGYDVWVSLDLFFFFGNGLC